MRNCLQMLSCKQDVKKGVGVSASGCKQAELLEWGLASAPSTPSPQGQDWQAGAWAGLGLMPRMVNAMGVGFNKQMQ